MVKDQSLSCAGNFNIIASFFLLFFLHVCACSSAEDKYKQMGSVEFENTWTK